jgi:tetrahydromethanopterin S-methyltransferase subunit D
MPWAGWIGGLLGWFVSDQGGTSLAQWDCRRAVPSVMLLIGTCGALLALLGGVLSLRVWRRLAGALDQPYAGARRFVAVTGMLAAGIFLLAILFQTVSSLIIPQCHA